MNKSHPAIPALAAVALLVPALRGQQPTLQLQTATPITSTATAAGQVPFTTQVGANQILPFLDITAMSSGSSGQAIAVARHVPYVDDDVIAYEAREWTEVLGTAPGFAAIGPQDVLLQITVPQPFLADIRVEFTVESTALAAQPPCRVDLGDDGSFEFAGRISGSYAETRMLSGQFAVRLRSQQALGGTGPQRLSCITRLQIRRDIGLGTVALTTHCSSGALDLDSTLRGELRIAVEPQPVNVGGIGVVVLGLAMQPFVVPTPQPCLLVPRPDVVAMTPPDGVLIVPLPPNLALAAFVQGIVVNSGALMPSPAYVITLP